MLLGATLRGEKKTFWVYFFWGGGFDNGINNCIRSGLGEFRG